MQLSPHIGLPIFAIVAALCACEPVPTTAYAQAVDADSKNGEATGAPWVSRTVEGWTVQINRRLLAEDKEALERAIGLLKVQLKKIARKVPAPAVAELQKVTLWFSPEYARTVPRAEYHPNVDWLKSNGRDPAMEKGVEFTNVRIFEAETRRMPDFALHELAHAYHDRVLGFEHHDVIAAFEQAKASGKYERVLQRDAKGKQQYARAYALTDHKEYFAEATEAYFGRNDFFPFDRSELMRVDPAMAAVLKRLWGEQGTER